MWHAVYTTPHAEDAIFTQTTMNIYFRTQTTQNYAEFSYIANARMGHPEEMHKRSTCDVCESLRSLRERKVSVCAREKYQRKRSTTFKRIFACGMPFIRLLTQRMLFSRRRP